MSVLAVTISNQWSATFSQPASFGTTPPALQSAVVALNNSTSVGGGSGTPTAGNWLFCLVGMNEQATTAGFTAGVGDDIHGFWRPGNETTSTWAVSTPAALTRTAVWYTANTARAAGNVYVAPNGAFDALTVLVVEVSGLGPWDTVAGISTNYSAAATSLSLSLGAPSAQALIIGAVAGDLSTATQAFAPGGWTGLHTLSVTNGSDHTCDSVLTSAYIVTSGSVSVSGTAGSATDLSGVLISVLTSASSPIPAAQNPNWPLVKFEGAFGGGFQTPQDQLTWTDLTTRLWSWNETTGVQYQLGSIQATDLELELDNFDNLLASDNPASYFYTAPGANWHPSSAFYDTLVAANSPNAWWKLADTAGSTAADSSGNSHTGTATSVTFANTSQAVTGNNSASFASGSTSHITTTYNPALSAVTVEAWVNYNSLSQGGNSPRLAANSNTSSDHKGFELLVNNSGVPQFNVGTGTVAGSASGGTVPATGWTYLAGTWDGTTITLYVNGVAVATAAFSGTLSAGNANIGLGFNPQTSSNYLNGLLAECAVYGTALTASQIAARYTAGPSVTGTPLRLRAALGTIGGQTVNRWYVISRNIEQWPQQVDPDYRRQINATATDIWSVLSSSGPSPYRGEVEQDTPYAWWPMDDQPLAGGVQPTSLRNAAAGNTNTLTIEAATGGVTAGDQYSTSGTDITSTFKTTQGVPPPSVAVYSVGQQQGWLYGDPQSSPQSYATSNPVTANPGSAAWEQTGLLGTGGSGGWFLACNDTGFPGLSGGVTFSLWWNAGFFGSASGFTQSTNRFQLAAQPSPGTITLAELATASNPVAVLQLDSSGHLILTTYNGATGTNHTIYSSSDLRSSSWHNVTLTTNGSTWTVYVDGGMTATVSGSGAGMTSAWTWLIIGADLGSSGGSTLSAATHMGNVAFSHAEVYPQILPLWRILAHYSAAVTAFGLLPAPQAISLSQVANQLAGVSYTPDGADFQGSYGYPGGGLAALASFSFSALAVAQAGSYTSGPSARGTTAGVGVDQSGIFYGYAVFVSWTGLAPSFGIYTAASANSETNAATACGPGDAFTSGYGSGASANGVCHTASGSGASPPGSASSLGDTVQQRIERALGYGGATYPGRCIDPASLAVQAATDIGGQQTGQNVTNIAQSDGGLLFIDNPGNLSYWQKSHLSGQYPSPVWTLTPQAPPTPGAAPTAIPYYREGFSWLEDPQRVWNAILITPFSPDGSSLADITPTQAAQVNASQSQYGTQPRQVTSYLQSATEMQDFADFLFGNYGTSQIRVDGMKVDAAPYPAAFPLVLGINVGDVVSVQNWQIGGGGATGTFRVSQIRRVITFGGDDAEDTARAEVTITADYEPPSQWS